MNTCTHTLQSKQHQLEPCALQCSITYATLRIAKDTKYKTHNQAWCPWLSCMSVVESCVGAKCALFLVGFAVECGCVHNYLYHAQLSDTVGHLPYPYIEKCKSSAHLLWVQQNSNCTQHPASIRLNQSKANTQKRGTPRTQTQGKHFRQY